MAEQTISFQIEDGQTFFADEVSITNNPVKFILDFKNSAPRIDIRAEQGSIPIKVTHNTIMMDTWLAKRFHELLGEHLAKYEKEFGKIVIPKQIEQAKKQGPVSSTPTKPGYFG
jgi:hypothetical protein